MEVLAKVNRQKNITSRSKNLNVVRSTKLPTLLCLSKSCDRNLNCHYTEKLTKTKIRKKWTEKQQIHLHRTPNFHSKAGNRQQKFILKMSI